MNASTSAGSGASPVRSSVTRRIRMRRSASSDGLSPSFARRACTKGVDGIQNLRAADRRHARTSHRLIRPMTFVLGAFSDPAADCILLLGGQLFVRRGGRHDAAVGRQRFAAPLRYWPGRRERWACREPWASGLRRGCRAACLPCANLHPDHGSGSTFPT